MPKKFIGMHIDEKIHKRFKILCDEMGLKMGKQAERLIISFVEIQEKNLHEMRKSVDPIGPIVLEF